MCHTNVNSVVLQSSGLNSEFQNSPYFTIFVIEGL